MTVPQKKTRLFEYEADPELCYLLKRLCSVWQRSGNAAHAEIATRVDAAIYRPNE